MNSPKQFRQGDVFLREVPSIPTTAKSVSEPNEKIVLAWGEVTGHHHRIENVIEEAAEFAFAEAGGIVRRFLKVFDKGAKLKHEEHATIPLPPGLYEIVQQREYSPEEIRNVAD